MTVFKVNQIYKNQFGSKCIQCKSNAVEHLCENHKD